MLYISAVPAYGRDYKTAKEVKAAWEEGKDFLIQDLFNSGYISKPEADEKGITVNIRFSQNRKVTVMKPKKVKA